MAKVKMSKSTEAEIEEDMIESADDAVDESEDVEESTEKSKGTSAVKVTRKKSKGNRRKRPNPFGGKSKSGFSSGLSSVFTLKNPSGDWNLMKIGLIVAGGALLWDYLSQGGFIGVFGPQGLLSRMTSSLPTTAPAPSTSAPSPSPGQPTSPTPGTSTQANGSTSPRPAGNTSTATTPSGTPQSVWDAYLASIGVQDNRVVSSVVSGDAASGSDATRDADKFKNDPRFREQMIIRAAQGYYYAIALVEAEGLTYNWDQWNFFRAKQGGTPINIDALGIAPRRGDIIGIRTFLATAGPDPLEADVVPGASGSSGVSGLGSVGGRNRWEWLM